MPNGQRAERRGQRVRLQRGESGAARLASIVAESTLCSLLSALCSMSGPVDITRVPKPWGHETIWARTDNYVGKILHINAGQALSVQYHNVKDETVFLLAGKIIYRVWQKGADGGPTDIGLQIGQAYRITPHTIHQMEAVTDCDVLEVSTNHLDDVVRLTDRYGREGTSAP